MGGYPPSPYPDQNPPEQPGHSYAENIPRQGYQPTQPIYSPEQPGYAPTLYAQAQPGYPPITVPGNRHSGLWIALTAIALLLLVAAGGAYYYFLVRSTPQKTLQSYCSAIKSDDAQALYNTYSSAAQAQTTVAQLQQGLRLVEFLSGGIEDCTVDANSIQENGTLATGAVTFKLSDNRSSSTTIHLVDESEQWKVENNSIFP